jgi:hypothetical protein
MLAPGILNDSNKLPTDIKTAATFPENNLVNSGLDNFDYF